MENGSGKDPLDIPDFLKRKRGDSAAKWEGFRLTKGPPDRRVSEVINGIVNAGCELTMPKSIPKGRKRKSSEQVKCLKRLGWVEWRISELSCEEALRIVSKGEGPPPRKKPGPRKKKRVLLIEDE